MLPISLPELPKLSRTTGKNQKLVVFEPDLLHIFIITFLVLKYMFLFFPSVLEGLGRSGRLIGSISTYPGTSPMLW